MREAPVKSTLYQKYCKLSEWIYKIMNFICVLCLIVELAAVLIMVVGRYVFNKVPVWCDQLSLMALVWMVILSITLALYRETHMRVELIDRLFSPKAIQALKYISNVIILIFSAVMTYHGTVLVELTWNTRLSGFRVPQGLMYLPLVLCGAVSVYMSVFCMVRRGKESGK